MSERTYVVAVDGNAYDRIGFLEAGTKKIALLYSSDSQTVIVNYLVIVPQAHLPEFVTRLCGLELPGLQPRAILKEDVASMKMVCPRYEIISAGHKDDDPVSNAE